MFKKTWVNTFLCILCVWIILTLNYFLFQIYVDRQLNMTSVWIASHDIPPRSQITESDLEEVWIAGNYVLNNTVLHKEDIIGKFTDIQGKIPAGSLFYSSMLYDQTELPDHPYTELKEGQALYTQPANSSVLASMVAGMRVDVYLTVTRKNDVPLTGCLLRSARIVTLKDHKGLDLQDPESTGTPYSISLAVNAEDLDLLLFAQAQGEMQLFANANTYETDAEAYIDLSSEITAYLNQQRNISETPVSE